MLNVCCKQGKDMLKKALSGWSGRFCSKLGRVNQALGRSIVFLIRIIRYVVFYLYICILADDDDGLARRAESFDL